MIYMIAHFLKRFSREWVKGLSVPLLAFVLVGLICLLGAIRAWMEGIYEDTLNNHPVIAELSDLSGDITDGLNIDERRIVLFTDPDVDLSLYEFTSNLMLRRTLYTSNSITLTGITDFDESVHAAFFEGYDKSILSTEMSVCLVSEDMLDAVNSGLLNVEIHIHVPGETLRELKREYDPLYNSKIIIMNDMVYEWVVIGHTRVLEPLDIDFDDIFDITIIEPYDIITEAELMIVGTVSNTEANTVYAPFWTVSEIAFEVDGLPPYSELLHMTVADNRELSAFKELALLSFSNVRPIFSTYSYAMMVYDSTFFETLEPLRQNIFLLDVATPVMYVISVLVGFLTSVLLTRRRRPEYAVMRSVGIHKRDIFVGAISEQLVLSTAGAALGFSLIALIWGYMSLERPAIFLACYMLGTTFSAVSAARTNVLEILREKE
jgi:hypothetical protein